MHGGNVLFAGPMTDESNDVTSTAKTSVLTTTGGITPTMTDESNDVTSTAKTSDLTTTGGITPTITDVSNDVTNTAAESTGVSLDNYMGTFTGFRTNYNIQILEFHY